MLSVLRFHVAQVCWLLYGLINQILHTYAHIKILFEIYPKLVSYFHSYISISHIAHSHHQPLSFRKVWKLYVHDLGLSLPIFHQQYLTGKMVGTEVPQLPQMQSTTLGYIYVHVLVPTIRDLWHKLTGHPFFLYACSACTKRTPYCNNVTICRIAKWKFCCN